MGQTIFDPNSIVFVSRGVIQMLKWYYIEKLKNEEQYVEFIEYMLKNSDFFSVVYFRYNERESFAYSARTAHPFQRNGAPFRFKLSKAQQVD